jgi:hypothetical protein
MSIGMWFGENADTKNVEISFLLSRAFSKHFFVLQKDNMTITLYMFQAR